MLRAVRIEKMERRIFAQFGSNCWFWLEVGCSLLVAADLLLVAEHQNLDRIAILICLPPRFAFRGLKGSNDAIHGIELQSLSANLFFPLRSRRIVGVQYRSLA